MDEGRKTRSPDANPQEHAKTTHRREIAIFCYLFWETRIDAKIENYFNISSPTPNDKMSSPFESANAAATLQLASKVVIVTGASRGVGAELARVCAAEGASVVVNYFQSKEKAEAVAAEINGSASPGRAIAIYGDVTSKADMEALVATAISEFGAVHGLVNNALASYQFDPSAAPASIKTLEWSAVQQQMEGTVRGAINAVQAVAPHFEAQGFGKILMIGARSMAVHYWICIYICTYICIDKWIDIDRQIER